MSLIKKSIDTKPIPPAEGRRKKLQPTREDEIKADEIIKRVIEKTNQRRSKSENVLQK